MNLWILRGETADKKGFEFLNSIRDHNALVLETTQIRHFDAPDKLVLRGQVILHCDSVVFEPFHPKPASTSTSTVSLCMSLEGVDENGLLVVPTPSIEPEEPFSFIVTNVGEQTVHGYRNTVLIPSAFHRTTSASYLGNLSQSGTTEIASQEYLVYGNFIREPIYKKERIRIGSIPLKADIGEYIFLWKIRCDDGVFPTDSAYGEIKVRVIPSGDLVARAVENLYKNLDSATNPLQV